MERSARVLGQKLRHRTDRDSHQCVATRHRGMANARKGYGGDMEPRDTRDQKHVLQDPEMLAQLERNMRRAGLPRRTFLAMASAVAGTAALAACGGTASPTAAPTA